MPNAIRIALVTVGFVCSTSSCANRSTMTLRSGDLRSDVGEIRVDVREETRHTEAVGGAAIALVAASMEDWAAPLRNEVADTAGHAVIAGLRPARYTIRVWAAGHDTVTQRVTMSAGQAEAVRVSLRNVRCTVVVTSTGPVCM